LGIFKNKDDKLLLFSLIPHSYQRETSLKQQHFQKEYTAISWVSPLKARKKFAGDMRYPRL
jgi:hypothetical protein